MHKAWTDNQNLTLLYLDPYKKAVFQIVDRSTTPLKVNFVFSHRTKKRKKSSAQFFVKVFVPTLLAHLQVVCFCLCENYKQKTHALRETCKRAKADTLNKNTRQKIYPSHRFVGSVVV